MSKQTTQSKKISIRLILSWFLGIYLTLIGIQSIFSKPFLALVAFIMAGVLIPPVTAWVDKNWHFYLSRGMKIVILIIGSIIVLILE